MERIVYFFLFFISFGVMAQLPTLSELSENVNELFPGGETVCARGEPFSFWVKKGSSSKLVIDFMGGGACWNHHTCNKDNNIFRGNLDDIRNKIKKGDLQGAYDFTNPNNPFKDWSYVLIGYCTGDIHWGDNEITYKSSESQTTIKHFGAKNVKATLNWIFKNFKDPKQVLVTGTSAGAYGSLYWTPLVREQYKDAKISQFGDSGVGVVTQDFFKNHFMLWNPKENAPNWIPGLDPERVDWSQLNIKDIYLEIGQHYPEIQMSHFTTEFDSTQAFFYESMGGEDAEEWSEKMKNVLQDVSQSLPNFNYFMAKGETHCILYQDFFYGLQSNGKNFTSWITNLLEGKKLQNVICENCL